jgi:hypothetical protein
MELLYFSEDSMHLSVSHPDLSVSNEYFTVRGSSADAGEITSSAEVQRTCPDLFTLGRRGVTFTPYQRAGTWSDS